MKLTKNTVAILFLFSVPLTKLLGQKVDAKDVKGDDKKNTVATVSKTIDCTTINRRTLQSLTLANKLKDFSKECTKLASKEEQVIVEHFLSDNKIDEYCNTDIHWFTLRQHEYQTLKADEKSSRTIIKEIEQIKFDDAFKQEFVLYGKPTMLNLVALNEKNAPLTLAMVKKLADHNNLKVPIPTVLLFDADHQQIAYMINPELLLLRKPSIQDRFDDEIEFVIAHELSHSKTKTCLSNFDLLLKFMGQKNLTTQTDFILFFLSAIERMVDEYALKITQKPSAYITMKEGSKIGREKRFKATEEEINFKVRTHAYEEECIAFGYFLLGVKKHD